uniref:Ribosomal protein S3 n=1 Tax=Melanthalia intermedia TaxID=172989 RepID=A0A345UBN3_9FLOR|nr:ribosomal protein S3 [Melanthalia intermedia]AXI97869.1 ribosomal protein S3 [Melanthalia intermedia]
MARKINPVSFRLGALQLWDFTLQNYGKLTYNSILHFYKRLQIKKVINQILSLNRFLPGSKELWFYNDKLFLIIYFANQSFDKNKLYSPLIENISKIFLKYFSIETYLRVYIKTNHVLTSNLLINYTKYLLQQNKNFVKILWYLCQFSENHLNSKKIIYSDQGIRLAYLRGFKIRLVGRFNDSRSQMAKTIQQGLEFQSLMCLRNYIEFFQDEIHMKSGSCGLQIWLFYELN